MKTLLYVFSGTGNTLKVGKEIASYLKTAEVFLIGSSSPVPDPQAYDLVGFGYPIHAFRAPEIFIDSQCRRQALLYFQDLGGRASFE
jgi:flavodoxin